MKQLTETHFESDKVILEKLSENHLDKLLDAGQNPAIWRHVLSNYCQDKSTLLKWFKQTAQYSADTQLPLVILDKETHSLVGSTRLFALDFRNDKLEIGHTFIRPEFQRSYINTHTKYLSLRPTDSQCSGSASTPLVHLASASDSTLLSGSFELKLVLRST